MVIKSRDIIFSWSQVVVVRIYPKYLAKYSLSKSFFNYFLQWTEFWHCLLYFHSAYCVILHCSVLPRILLWCSDAYLLLPMILLWIMHLSFIAYNFHDHHYPKWIPEVGSAKEVIHATSPFLDKQACLSCFSLSWCAFFAFARTNAQIRPAVMYFSPAWVLWAANILS